MKASKKAFREPYEAREDTMLLIKHMKKYASDKKDVLEMGTGSGVVAIEAAKYAKNVLALDINPRAIALAKKNAKGIKNITIKESDLFSNIDKKSKFDLILFNPPYLPYHKDDPDVALDGGKHGYELLGKFLNQINPYLKNEGKILVVFSTFTRPEKVKEFIFKNCFEFKELDIDHILFEDLFLWEIKKSKLLKSLEDKDIENIKYFTKGHRGYIYQAKFKKNKIMIKINNPESRATNRIENEVNFLKRIEKHNIAPKVLMHVNENKEGEQLEYFFYKYIKGEFIHYFTEDKNTKKKEVINVLKQVFEQMFLLDKLGINKEEMHHPVRHVIINKKKIKGKETINTKLIDFERANMTKKPKNVTQFCQFIVSNKFGELLRNKKINVDMDEMIKLAQTYKNNINEKNFNNILELIK
jgi:release factor glutamine methyltransferase